MVERTIRKGSIHILLVVITVHIVRNTKDWKILHTNHAFFLNLGFYIAMSSTMSKYKMTWVDM